jgi:hypothetical protein
MRGLEGRGVLREEEQVPDPEFIGPPEAPRVGVVSGGLGSRTLVDAIAGIGGYRAAAVGGIAASALRQCEALVLPARRIPATLTKPHCWLIWDWVGAGGRLVLTHDAVGYRHHPVLFPWVCSGGTAHVENSTVDVVWAPSGREPVGIVTPSYVEHILLQPCLRAQMTVIAVDTQTGRPAVSGAMFDSGRVLACGLALGVNRLGSDDSLNPGEAELLDTMLAWLMG